MLDHVLIARKTGVVLWEKVWAPVKGAPVDALVHAVLLEQRLGVDVHHDGDSSVKWSVDNELDIVVIAVYQRILTLEYVDALLATVKTAFVGVLKEMPAEARDDLYPCDSFTPAYMKVHDELERRALEEKRTAKKVPRTFQQSAKFANTKQGNKESNAVGGAAAAAARVAAADAPTGAAASAAAGGAEGAAPAGELSAEQIAANIAKMRKGGPGKKKKGGGGKRPGEEEEEEAPAPSKPKSLDYSKRDASGAVPRKAAVFKGDGRAVDLDAQFGDLGDEEEVGEASATPSKSKGIFASLAGLVGAKALERADLDPVIEKLRDRLVEKNVAMDISDQICDSVCASLLGKQLGSFASLSTTVRQPGPSASPAPLAPARPTTALPCMAGARRDADGAPPHPDARPPR